MTHINTKQADSERHRANSYEDGNPVSLLSTRTAAETDAHPDELRWKFFFDSPDEAEGVDLALHLSGCEECQVRIGSLPPPPRRIFGRPIQQYVEASPIEAEESVQGLMRVCEKSRVGLHFICGEWNAETLSYQILATCLSRLARNGKSYAVYGIRRTDTRTPVFSDADIVVVLDGVTFDSSSWKNAAKERLVLVCGELDMIHAAGIEYPSLIVCDRFVEDSCAARLLTTLEEAIEREPPPSRAGILANALCTDWPAGMIRHYSTTCASLFVAVDCEPGDLVSVASPWVARRLMAKRPQVARILWEELLCLANDLPLGMLHRLKVLWDAFIRQLAF